VGVGDGAGHVEAKPGQYDEAREVPRRLQLVLRPVVRRVVELLEGLAGEALRLALDLHARRDGEGRHARLPHREMVRAVVDTRWRPLVGLELEIVLLRCRLDRWPGDRPLRPGDDDPLRQAGQDAVVAGVLAWRWLEDARYGEEVEDLGPGGW